jgi:nucleotide-binding universal stress UspA family protein
LEIAMKTILVALDGSPRARGVLAAALALTKLAGGKLLLFRGIGIPAEMPPHVWALEEASLVDMIRHDAEVYLAGLASHVPKESLAGIRVSVGAPWQTICDTARDEKVDLIVIGSHGYSTVDRLLGTTAAKVVNHADRSVLVARGEPSL